MADAKVMARMRSRLLLTATVVMGCHGKPSPSPQPPTTTAPAVADASVPDAAADATAPVAVVDAGVADAAVDATRPAKSPNKTKKAKKSEQMIIVF